MKIHLLTGFLGSGKTTAIQQACKQLLQKNISVGVIANDQGMHLVDGDFFNSLNIPNRQVINGCFCCNYHDLEKNIDSLLSDNHPEIIFAEAVGSCTDIMATVLKPLCENRKDTSITLSTFADVRLLHLLFIQNLPLFESSVKYIYIKQLEEAAVIVINKIDLADAKMLQSVSEYMQLTFPDKRIIYQDSFSEKNVEEWLSILNKNKNYRSSPSPEIDYDLYAEGEAKLAWLDTELSITAPALNAIHCANVFINNLRRAIKENNLSIGHLKFLLNGKMKHSVTSIKEEHTNAFEKNDTSNIATLLVNARVQTEPAVLKHLVWKAVRNTEIMCNCNISISNTVCFKPGYPKPVYRF